MTQREIKFRVFFPDLKMDYFPETFTGWLNDNFKPDGYAEGKEPVFMQYTGLKDKNGKEIYEGDIVKFYPILDDILKGKEPLVTTVSFDDGCFYVLKMNTDMCLLIDAAKAWNNYEKGGLEVVGNIYENSDLLANT